jgi:O-methyltransferase
LEKVISTTRNLNRWLRALRDPGRALARIHPFLAGPRRFHLQGRMDIDPRSIWHDPDFVAATGGFLIPEDRVDRRICSLEAWDNVRRDMLVLLMRSVIARRVEGDFAELGVYQGGSARLIHHYAPERVLHLFDTFSGFDAREIARPEQKGQFADTSVAAVLKRIAPLNANVIPHVGRFPDSVPEELRSRRVAFVHLDADLFAPIIAGLEFFYPRTSRGGVVVVHDYNAWPGARCAVDEFFADKSEVPIPMPDKSGSAIIVKQ